MCDINQLEKNNGCKATINNSYQNGNNNTSLIDSINAGNITGSIVAIRSVINLNDCKILKEENKALRKQVIELQKIIKLQAKTINKMTVKLNGL